MAEFNRDEWLPLAKSLYDDSPYSYESFSLKSDGSRREFEELITGRQDAWIERAMGYAALVPGLLELCAERDELAAQVAEVRNITQSLDRQSRDEVQRALDGPPRCPAWSRFDDPVRCTHEAGHGPVHLIGYGGRVETWDHAGRGAAWRSK